MTIMTANHIQPDRLSLEDYTARRVTYWTGKLTRQLHLSRHDAEDFQQEMHLEVYRALQRFDAYRSCQRTFISHILKRFARKLIRKTMRHRRHAVNRATSLSDAGELAIHAASRHPLDETRQVDLRLDLQTFLQSLSPRLQQVAQLLMVHPPGQVGREMDRHRSSVSRAIGELRDKLTEAGFDSSDLCPR